MDIETVDKLAKTVTDRILTPVIYMVEEEDGAALICFCDRNLKMQELYNAEAAASKVAGKKIEIIDIREYSEAERVEIVHQAELIYSEHPMVEQIFMMSMLEDLQISIDRRNKMLERYRENGSYYLQ